MQDDGHAVHYTAVAPGTPVLSSDGLLVGAVVQVVDNYAEHILDGFVIETSDGEVRFVDGPDVRRTAERAVTLAIDAQAAAQLPPPDPGAPRFRANPKAGRVGRLFGRGWRKH